MTTSINDIEQIVLGCILLDEKVIKKCLTVLQPADFTNEQNKMLYIAMLANEHEHIPNDFSTILTRLDKSDNNVDVDYFMAILNIVPTAENADAYINELKEKSNIRTLYTSFESIVSNRKLTSTEITDILKGTMSNLSLISNATISNINDGLEDYLNSIADGRTDNVITKTLYTKFDSRVSLKDGNLMIISGRPGTGKSAYALNICKNFLEQGKKVLFISLEMTKEEITDRLLSLITGIDHDRISSRSGLTPREKTMLFATQSIIIKYNLNTYDKGGLSIENLINLSARMKQDNELDILIVDHIGLVKTDRYGGNRTQEAGYISNILKEIAMDLKIPVVALSQLNRNVIDSRTGETREPNLSDLKNTGNIEEDANIVVMLHSEDGNELYNDREILLKITKNRGGRLGSVVMNFKANVMRFRETDNGAEIGLANDKKVESTVVVATKEENIFEVN